MSLKGGKEVILWMSARSGFHCRNTLQEPTFFVHPPLLYPRELEGKSRKEIEAVTRYGRSGISDLIERYNEAGLDGLKDGRRKNNGAPRKLSHLQLKQIIVDIEKGIELGYVWSGKKLMEHILTKYGIEIPQGSIYRIFKELGFSLQKPRPSHAKGDPVAQEAFKTKFYRRSSVTRSFSTTG